MIWLVALAGFVEGFAIGARWQVLAASTVVVGVVAAPRLEVESASPVALGFVIGLLFGFGALVRSASSARFAVTVEARRDS